MYSYQSPQIIHKKFRQNQQSSQQQKNTLQKSQDDGSNPDIYHFTASFGVLDSQQGTGVKNFFKPSQEDLYYKTQSGKNFEYPQQMIDNHIQNVINQNNLIQQNYIQNDVRNQISQNDEKTEQSQYTKQNPNQLLLRSSEFNEDTLQQQYYNSLKSYNQSQQYSQFDYNQQLQSQYSAQDKIKKSSENKIQMYLQQMVDNTQSIKEAEGQIQNFMSLPSQFSRREGSQHQHNYQSEEQDVQRIQPPPAPELQPQCQITQSEIALLKQKQRQSSMDKQKESKQQKVLNEIAQFYRQLAENKKQKEERGDRGNSLQRMKKSESLNKLSQDSNKMIQIEKERELNFQNKQKLAHSQSTSNISNNSFTQNQQSVQINKQKQSKQKIQSKMKISNNHSQSVQSLSMNKSENDEIDNQENIQQFSNRQVQGTGQYIQKLPLQKRNNIKNNKDDKQVNQRYSLLQNHKQSNIQNTQQNYQSNKLQNNDSFMSSSQLKEELKISLTNILDLAPIQLQTFESKIKKQDYFTQKNEILRKYKQLEECFKYTSGRQNYLSSIQESIENSGIKYSFRINLVYELQLIGKISKKHVLEGIKEVIELSDSYETITQDIQALEAGKNSKRNQRTVAQQNQEDQTILVLKDMQMRIAQKIFFIYLWKVQSKYKKEIDSQLTSFEQERNKLRQQLAINILKHYNTVQKMKKWILNNSKNEIWKKKMKKIFDAIKAKGKKYNYYKPFILAIMNNHRCVLKQNTLLSLFENMQKRKTKQRVLVLCKKIYNSHLFTKSFLILKAFINRKKNNQIVQTMNAKNITLKYTNELRSSIHKHYEYSYKQHFKWRVQKDVNKNENNKYNQGILLFSDLENSQQTLNTQRFKETKDKNEIGRKFNHQKDLKNHQGLSKRDLNCLYTNNQENQGEICEQEKQNKESECLDYTYDSQQFQKHFYCEEEFLSSARNLLQVKRQITLDKLDRLKNQDFYVDDQTSFLQKNKEKLLEQNREGSEDFLESMIYLQSDSKMNLVQIPQPQNQKRLPYEKNCQNVQRDQFKESKLQDLSACKAIMTLKQHIKQIIRVLKKLSQKKESFKFKNPIDLLLRKDQFQSTSDKFEQSKAGLQQKNIKHPLNQHLEMIKHIEQSERKQVCSYLFYHWKIIFLERTLDAEITLLNSLRKCKSVLMAFKNRYRENSEIISLKQQIRQEKVKSNIFSEWAKLGIERMEKNNSKLSFFYQKICFRRFHFFSTYSKIQKGADNFYENSLIKRIFYGWTNISRENSQVRKRYKISLKKHFFSHWKNISMKVSFLRRFWKRILFTPDEYLFDKYGNKKNLLRAILKNWRGIVIENENSMKQKIAIKSAIQHREVVQKTKSFFEWLKCVRVRKGINKLFESRIIKKVFSNKIFKPWKETVYQQQQIILQFRRKMNINNLMNIFHFLKIKSMQRKLIKCFCLKKFFLVWKQYKEYRQQILPRSYRQRKILKLSLASMMYNQLGEVRQRAKMEKSTKYFLYHIKKFMKTCLKLWLKYSEKRKSKRSLKAKLSKYAERSLKKRIFTSFKLIRVMARLKIVQNQKAIQFKENQCAKKYNLQRLTNNPHLNPQLQEILQILHRWKAYSIKQKSIKFIQSRIKKFHKRKTLTHYFNQWQSAYNQIVSQQQQETSEFEDRYNKMDTQKRRIEEKTSNNKLNKVSNYISNKQMNYKDKIENKNEFLKEQKRITQDKKQQISDNQDISFQLNKQQTSSQQILYTFSQVDQRAHTFSQKSNHSVEENSKEQKNHRFQRSQSRSTLSATSRSNSPNNAKGSLKTNVFQDNHRKSRKSVRFEFNSQESQNYPSALTSHRLDYFDQKYNENEAFYQKLLTQRSNTSQM